MQTACVPFAKSTVWCVTLNKDTLSILSLCQSLPLGNKWANSQRIQPSISCHLTPVSTLAPAIRLFYYPHREKKRVTESRSALGPGGTTARGDPTTLRDTCQKDPLTIKSQVQQDPDQTLSVFNASYTRTLAMLQDHTALYYHTVLPPRISTHAWTEVQLIKSTFSNSAVFCSGTCCEHHQGHAFDSQRTDKT